MISGNNLKILLDMLYQYERLFVDGVKYDRERSVYGGHNYIDIALTLTNLRTLIFNELELKEEK